jgi:acetylornithine deacetylase/succinyl-diaminopimelate desuccinylase-like protein
MPTNLDKILKHLEDDQAAALGRLCELLSIRSISTDPAYNDQCEAAARWVTSALTDCGLTAQMYETKGHPAVLARTTEEIPGAPRVLFYGHYDVQPPDPLDLWKTPPFEPQVRNGKLFARGSSDDKGQVMCFIEALRAWKLVTGSIPLNLTVLIEGDEECGSAGLDDFIEAHADDLRADVAVVSDTSMWDDNTPAITYALRGLLYFDIQLHGPSRDLHSGVYGGTVANPATELVKVLGQLLDANHHVTVPGFYDDVVSADEAERKRWAELNFSDEKWAASVGVKQLHGEKGYGTLERRWARPSCDVNGLYGGYMGAGAKTVIPSFAGAKVSFRLAADQDPRKITEAFTKWLQDRTPPGCRWQITEHGHAHPVIVPTDSPHLAAAARAVEIGFNQKPKLVREGATIPVVSTFKRVLGMNTLLVGFGRHDDAIHSPNEKFEVANFVGGCRTHAALLSTLSEK